jgi:hypothetical protein
VTTTPGTTIATDTQLAFSGATLNAVGAGAHTIAGIGGSGGNLRVYNTGVINVGTASPTLATVLTVSTGSVTVGALDPNGTGTGGTLNLYATTTLAMPAAASPSTFDVTALGVINMKGATITMATARVANLNIHMGGSGLANGQLNSLGAPALGDVIAGNVVNNGTIAFGGAALHALGITAATGGGFYTQGPTGTLAMRLDNGEVNDVLTVAATATLNGTLSLSGLNPLTALQTWDLIGAAAIGGDFQTRIWPDGGTWVSAVGPPYSVTKAA